MNQDLLGKTGRGVGGEGHETYSKIAEVVRAACVATAIRAYEDAGTSGLCTEGAFEYAVGAVRTLDLDKLIREIG